MGLRGKSLSERGLGFVLLAPAALLLLLIVVYPIATLVWNSFFDIHLAEPWKGEPFSGFDNYRRAFEDDRFWSSLVHTLINVVVTVPGALLVGLGLALLANMPFRRKWPVRLGLLLPWALPLVFSGLIFRWFFEYKQGIVNDVLTRIGAEPLAWLTDPQLARDGASRWQKFVSITLPMLRPAIFVALIFRTITAIQTFDIPYAMTGGGPGDSTETLAMYIQKTTLDFLDFGYGSALATLMFIASMIATSGYLRYTRRSAGREA